MIKGDWHTCCASLAPTRTRLLHRDSSSFALPLPLLRTRASSCPAVPSGAHRTQRRRIQQGALHCTTGPLAAHGGEARLQVRLRHNRRINHTNLGVEPQVPVARDVALLNWLPPLGHGHAGTCVPPHRSRVTPTAVAQRTQPLTAGGVSTGRARQAGSSALVPGGQSHCPSRHRCATGSSPGRGRTRRPPPEDAPKPSASISCW